MKRLLALIAALALLACPAALAETTDGGETVTVKEAYKDFDVTMVIPEGYAMTEEHEGGNVYLCVKSAETNTPDFDITVAYSEEYAGVTLNELSDDEKQVLLDVMDDDFMEPKVYDLVTEHGTEVFLINEDYKDGKSYFASGFSIYKGYFVQIYVSKPNFEQLAQADLDMAMKLLSDMWFVDK